MTWREEKCALRSGKTPLGALPEWTVETLGCPCFFILWAPALRPSVMHKEPRASSWCLDLTFGPRDPCSGQKTIRQRWSLPSLCEYAALAGPGKDASAEVSSTGRGRVSRKSFSPGAGEARWRAHQGHVVPPQSSVLKTLQLRQKTWPPWWDQTPLRAAFWVPWRSRVSAHHPKPLGQPGSGGASHSPWNWEEGCRLPPPSLLARSWPGLASACLKGNKKSITAKI